ncbi:diaminopimelate decarboxylase [Thiorhodovibrio frisius]|uniref:Diaminopimelate decarboxylase n=1 Tax=Thiorhodovibrio frisius TaxID=631362 RepID=H8YXR4_9GAMM|nr:diaminopimelate decarboxylase [Thiorhodovibrio frisius]EIC23240.1 diaminopimelate decarboxylase [Thiorhodovibrio frisius]WPL23684.1 Diaminopimelate decarboxylase [Thiorhodovibrio frisius]
MDEFTRKAGDLHAEAVPLQAIAERHGTPCYVYSRATLERHWRAFDAAFAERDHLICFAVKANSNLAVLNVLARMGSGFDIVSVGELERVLTAGGDPGRVVFSGVGKRVDEISRALEVGIHCFNVESPAELERIDAIARAQGLIAPVSLRVNPDVDAGTHPYIATGLAENKFGIAIGEAVAVYQLAARLPGVRVVGIDCHIGSQLTELAPFVAALERVLALADELERLGIGIAHLDLGGGLGVRYIDEQPPSPAAYVSALLERLGERPYRILLEPGRAIAANAGILLTRVEHLKHNGERHFAIVDAAMNDLIRPALYQAQQDIVQVCKRDGDSPGEVHSVDLVGPVCETGDFLGKARRLALAEGDLLAVRSSGAYGFVMSSNYNSRPRAPEVMVDGDQVHLIRERERIADLFAGESCLPPAPH